MNLRLFVALEPPEPVRRRIAALQARLRRDAGRHADEVRWVPPENVHLTLQFLGSVPEGRLPEVLAAVVGAAAASRPLRLLVPLLSSLPLQFLAYHVADLKGTDVDQPRNLAKSVTVE